jgi:hypothetical protein
MSSDIIDKVTPVLFSAVKKYGFALGGGQALRVLNIVDRKTQDIDGFNNSLSIDIYQSAEDSVLEELNGLGLLVQVIERNDFLRRFLVTDALSKEEVVIELTYAHRSYVPDNIDGVGPVLHIKDLLEGKLVVFWDRAHVRDFIDIDAMIACNRYSIDDLFRVLRKARPEATRVRFIQMIGSVSEISNNDFSAYGIDNIQAAEIRTRLINLVRCD